MMTTPDTLRALAARRRQADPHDGLAADLAACAAAWDADRRIVALAKAYCDAVAECNGIHIAEATLFAALAAWKGNMR